MNVAVFERVSFNQFKKDFLDTLGVRYLLDHKYLAKNKTGEFDNVAVSTAIYTIYERIRLPERSTKGSAGYDFFAPFQIDINYCNHKRFPTGIKCSIENGWFLAIVPRSSLGFKYGIHLANTIGIIDSDYYNCEKNEGHIMMKLVNESVVGDGYESVDFDIGDAYCQGIFLPYGLAIDDECNTERVGGLGSTGK